MLLSQSLSLMESADCLSERLFVTECATAIEHVVTSIEEYEMGNAGHTVLVAGLFVSVDIDYLEVNITKFTLGRLKHGGESFARPSPVSIKFEDFFDLSRLGTARFSAQAC